MPKAPKHLSNNMFVNVRVFTFSVKASVVGGSEHSFGAIECDFPTFDGQIRWRRADILYETGRCS